MFDYLENVIVEASEDLKNSRSYYPGNDSLMKVDVDSPRLPIKDADLFHCHYYLPVKEQDPTYKFVWPSYVRG